MRALKDEEIQQMREAIEGSKLTPADLVVWDCLIVFGIRPQELIDLQLTGTAAEHPVAVVTRSMVSSKGATRPRQVPAVCPQSAGLWTAMGSCGVGGCTDCPAGAKRRPAPANG